jgi:hypothetical protein
MPNSGDKRLNIGIQLPAGLLASFPSKINTFRKRVKNIVTSKGIKLGVECE